MRCVTLTNIERESFWIEKVLGPLKVEIHIGNWSGNLRMNWVVLYIIKYISQLNSKDNNDNDDDDDDDDDD